MAKSIVAVINVSTLLHSEKRRRWAPLLCGLMLWPWAVWRIISTARLVFSLDDNLEASSRVRLRYDLSVNNSCKALPNRSLLPSSFLTSEIRPIPARERRAALAGWSANPGQQTMGTPLSTASLMLLEPQWVTKASTAPLCNKAT